MSLVETTKDSTPPDFQFVTCATGDCRRDKVILKDRLVCGPTCCQCVLSEKDKARALAQLKSLELSVVAA